MVNRLIKGVINAFAEYAGAWPVSPDEPKKPPNNALECRDFDREPTAFTSGAAVPACRLVYSADRIIWRRHI